MGGNVVVPRSFLPEKSVDRSGTRRREEHAFRVDPAIAFDSAAADEYGPGRAQSDQLVGVDGKIAGRERSGIFQEIAGHPVILLRPGNIAHLLAKDVPVELRACFA